MSEKNKQAWIIQRFEIRPNSSPAAPKPKQRRQTVWGANVWKSSWLAQMHIPTLQSLSTLSFYQILLEINDRSLPFFFNPSIHVVMPLDHSDSSLTVLLHCSSILYTIFAFQLKAPPACIRDLIRTVVFRWCSVAYRRIRANYCGVGVLSELIPLSCSGALLIYCMACSRKKQTPGEY